MGLARGCAGHILGVGALVVTLASCSAAGSEGSKLLARDADLPEGVLAADLTLDAPFTLQVAPTISGPGGIFSVWTKGDLDDAWLGSVDANIDREIDGTWRTLWIITENDYPSDPFRVDGSTADRESLAVGIALDKQLLFAVPDDVPIGIYRICRNYVHGVPGGEHAYVCAPLTIESSTAADPG